MERADLARFSFLILEGRWLQTETDDDEREFSAVSLFSGHELSHEHLDIPLAKGYTCVQPHIKCRFRAVLQFHACSVNHINSQISKGTIDCHHRGAQLGERLSLTQIHTAAKLIRNLSHNHSHPSHKEQLTEKINPSLSNLILPYSL